MRAWNVVPVLLAVILVSGCTPQSGVSTGPDPQPAKAPPYTPTGEEPRVSVSNFKNFSLFESATLGPGTSRIFETALVRSRRFRLIERDALNEVLKEHRLSLSGIMTGSAEITGGLVPVDYIITGAVTEFGVRTTGTRVSGAYINPQVLIGAGGSMGKQRGTSRMAVDVKIIDIKSGRILYMTTAVGEAFSENVTAGLGLLSVAGIQAAKIRSGVEGMDQTSAGKAARVAAESMISKMVADDVMKWLGGK
jgi:curli biogenesis system outer membrane secretion channel CsgG